MTWGFMMTTIGFTGTQKGMTVAQVRSVRLLLFKRRVDEVHHGMCIGADEQFHRLCAGARIPIIGHPPINTSKMMQFDPFQFKQILEPREYLVRNHNIVDTVQLMIATPKGFDEERRGSGTWATIRYTRKIKSKVLIIVWPDGAIQ